MGTAVDCKTAFIHYEGEKQIEQVESEAYFVADSLLNAVKCIFEMSRMEENIL